MIVKNLMKKKYLIMKIDSEVAIIGIECRFPEGDSIENFGNV